MLYIDNHEIAIKGRFPKIAKLRHEWFESLSDPPATIEKLRAVGASADIFTFVPETCEGWPVYPYYCENTGIAVLKIKDYDNWWDGLHYKTRNKVRRGRKSGVTLRQAKLDEEFAQGVEAIYNESPIRQGRKFIHYGQTAASIMEELTSFSDRTYLIGAYYGNELIGFMKLIQGNNVLRTVHFIAKLSHREKPVMDALIAEAVALCDKNKTSHLQYGSWADGGIGVFREKHGFVKLEVPRYYVPLNLRGQVLLQAGLHRPVQDRLPKSWRETMMGIRSRWNSFRHESSRSAPNREIAERINEESVV